MQTTNKNTIKLTYFKDYMEIVFTMIGLVDSVKIECIYDSIDRNFYKHHGGIFGAVGGTTSNGKGIVTITFHCKHKPLDQAKNIINLNHYEMFGDIFVNNVSGQAI